MSGTDSDLVCAPCGKRFKTLFAFRQHVDAKHQGLASETFMRCPHCAGQVRFMPSSAALFRGVDYGPMWRCDPCDAHVGCHRNTAKPKGTLATRPTRAARQRAHAMFDPLWKSGVWSRTDCYAWLAAAMGIHPDDCHISLFDEAQCARVVELVRQRTPRPTVAA